MAKSLSILAGVPMQPGDDPSVFKYLVDSPDSWAARSAVGAGLLTEKTRQAMDEICSRAEERARNPFPRIQALTDFVFPENTREGDEF